MIDFSCAFLFSSFPHDEFIMTIFTHRPQK